MHISFLGLLVNCLDLSITYIFLFQYPTLSVVKEIKAHSAEIDDLDFHPHSTKVTVSRNLNQAKTGPKPGQ